MFYKFLKFCFHFTEQLKMEFKVKENENKYLAQKLLESDKSFGKKQTYISF